MAQKQIHCSKLPFHDSLPGMAPCNKEEKGIDSIGPKLQNRKQTSFCYKQFTHTSNKVKDKASDN